MAQLRQSLNARPLVPTPELSEAMLLLLLDTKPVRPPKLQSHTVLSVLPFRPCG